MRFLAVGDPHLDAFPEYGRAPGDRLRDQAQVWERAMEIAIEEEVDAVLFAGDAFHVRRPTPAAMLAFLRPLARLEADGIPLIAIVGNHDVESSDRPTALEVVAYGQAGIEVFRQPGIRLLPAMGQANTLAVCALPWAPVSRIVAQANGGDRDDLLRGAAETLLEVARGLRAQVDGPAILLLHWAISGAALPTGLPIDVAREVILPLADLETLGFDLVVAGHVHKPQLLGSEDAPGPMLYTGSPLPLNFGEAGCEHGVWVIDPDAPLSAANPTRERFVPIQSRPFVTLDYDATDPTNPGVLAEIGAGDFSAQTVVPDAIVRFRYRLAEDDARRFPASEIRRALLDAGAAKVSLHPEIVRETRGRVGGVDETLDELAALNAYADAQQIEQPMRTWLEQRTTDYLEAAVRA